MPGNLAKMPQAFLEEVRAFLLAHLTPDLRMASRETVGTHSAMSACRLWHQRLFEKSWIAPAWPKEFGGTGWSVEQRMAFERECAENDAPTLFAAGLRSVGPLLIEMGTKEQQGRYLPAILSGQDLWCQGFSEPGAGSDLAAIAMQASAADDAYILNGSKIWTTGAHLSNRMFCLVRTLKSDRPQEGITFLLIDMDTPGISVQPILMLNGEHEFSQVHFENVGVPKRNRVGQENDGWAAANVLMRHARGSNTTSGHLRKAMRAVWQLQTDRASAAVRTSQAVCQLEIDLDTFCALEMRCKFQRQADHQEQQEKITASFLKTVATELHQRIAEVAKDLVGSHAMVGCDQNAENAILLKEGALATSRYLGSRAASIYSGTNEIHRNQMARHIEKGGALLSASLARRTNL